MKKNYRLLLFLSLNAAALCVCVYFLTHRIRALLTGKPPPPRLLQPQRPKPAPPLEKPPPPPDWEKRSILFQYWDSTAKTVSLTSDFTEWKPQPMQKSEKNLWQISWEVVPGTHTYLFLVNGKTYPDPNNSKRKEGKSLLVVWPKEAE